MKSISGLGTLFFIFLASQTSLAAPSGQTCDVDERPLTSVEQLIELGHAPASAVCNLIWMGDGLDNAIKNRNPSTTKKLLRLLDSPSSDIIGTTVQALAASEDPEAERALMKLFWKRVKGYEKNGCDANEAVDILLALRRPRDVEVQFELIKVVQSLMYAADNNSTSCDFASIAANDLGSGEPHASVNKKLQRIIDQDGAGSFFLQEALDERK